MNVGMVNMLVAMYADSYAAVKGNAKVEYSYLSLLRVSEHQRVLLRMPPPFNLPFVLWDLGKFLCQKLARSKLLRRIRSQKPTRSGPGSASHVKHLLDIFLENESDAESTAIGGVLDSTRSLMKAEAADAASRHAELVGATADVQATVTELRVQMTSICSRIAALELGGGSGGVNVGGEVGGGEGGGKGDRLGGCNGWVDGVELGKADKWYQLDDSPPEVDATRVTEQRPNVTESSGAVVRAALSATPVVSEALAHASIMDTLADVSRATVPVAASAAELEASTRTDTAVVAAPSAAVDATSKSSQEGGILRQLSVPPPPMLRVPEMLDSPAASSKRRVPPQQLSRPEKLVEAAPKCAAPSGCSSKSRIIHV